MESTTRLLESSVIVHSSTTFLLSLPVLLVSLFFTRLVEAVHLTEIWMFNLYFTQMNPAEMKERATSRESKRPLE